MKSCGIASSSIRPMSHSFPVWSVPEQSHVKLSCDFSSPNIFLHKPPLKHGFGWHNVFAVIDWKQDISYSSVILSLSRRRYFIHDRLKFVYNFEIVITFAFSVGSSPFCLISIHYTFTNVISIDIKSFSTLFGATESKLSYTRQLNRSKFRICDGRTVLSCKETKKMLKVLLQCCWM